MATREPQPRIPLARPSIGDGEIAASQRALLSGRLVLGRENERFEARLAAITGRRHAIAVASGTAALELGLWALDVAPGDEVIVPSFGFVAAANAVARLGATPVPADVAAGDWNIDVDGIAELVTERTRAIVSIDQLGLVAESAPLEALAEAQGIPLLDDAACGFSGCDSTGRPGGGYGRCATFSFHPRKVITTGEGGAIVCDDDELAASLRALRNHGQAGRGRFVRRGTNARLGEIAAAIGCAQLDRLDAMLAERQLLAKAYRQRLAKLVSDDRISWQAVPNRAVHTFQTFAVLLSRDIDRARVVAHLEDHAIEAGAATYAFHRLESFAGVGGGRALPVSDALHDRSLALPFFIGMRSAALDRVADCLAEAVS